MAAHCPQALARIVRQLHRTGRLQCRSPGRAIPSLIRHFSETVPYQQTSTATTTADTDAIASHPKQVKYTTESYPNLKRDPKYSDISSEHVQFFKSTLGGDAAVIDGVTRDAGDDLEGYNSDWMRKYRGHTRLVVKPKSTEEVTDETGDGSTRGATLQATSLMQLTHKASECLWTMRRH